MQRRHMLAGSLAALAGSVLPVRSQPAGQRAAVVIGVDKCVGFPVLNAASTGALEVKAWLEGEGYEVRDFVDSKGARAILRKDITDAIRAFIARGSIQQLVIYFAGHGLIKDADEVWLLSAAPEDGGELIGLNSSFRLAKQSGIPNVIFLSDACRSLPQTVAQLQIFPAPIFPNPVSITKIGKVDHMLAAQVGYAANEFEIESAYQGVFTSALLKAFTAPDESMVVTRPNGERVIPNRKLETYLLREVPKLAQSKDFRLKQVPECEIPSSDDVYLARVAPNATIAGNAPKIRKATRSDINSSELGALINDGVVIAASVPSIRTTQASIDLEAIATGFTDTRKEVLATFDVSRLWREVSRAEAGFVIVGRNVKEVAVPRGASAEIVNSGPNSVVSVNFGDPRPGCSVAMRFDDGTGIVYAALRNYVATVSASEHAITNVAYDAVYEVGETPPYIKDLRATAAAAFQFGVLRFRGTQKERQAQATAFGEKIRYGKSADPSLGIYAAYALDEASEPERVASVRSYMRGDLGVDIFDVAMLAGVTVRDAGTGGVVPCCPMLSVGWSYIASSKATLAPLVAEAQAYLIPSPWTYFQKQGIDLLLPAIRTWALN